MRNSFDTPARVYAPGIGDAVADRTINRKITKTLAEPTKVTIEVPRRDDMALDAEVEAYCALGGHVIDGYFVTAGDGDTVTVELNVTGIRTTETWEDVALRVATGNTMLAATGDAREQTHEFVAMHHHLRQASLLMSGRHLQHGDETQPSRNQEVFTNCSSSAMSFLEYYLLLNGSGVGRCYDDAMMLVDWNYMPVVECVIEASHADVQRGLIKPNPLRDVRHLYNGMIEHYFKVPDSREGWAKAVEQIERLSFERTERDTLLILDFSDVRPKGAPIAGMQNRPASGPGPMIEAVRKIAAVRAAQTAPWQGTMFVDHYLAECVLVGGARRAARMATKTWRDRSVLEFIQIKRGGFLWSSNNSVTVDEEFWKLVGTPIEDVERYESPQTVELARHAKAVFDAICEAAYFDQTGEPGLINADRLVWSDEGTDVLMDGEFAGSSRYQLDAETKRLSWAIAQAWRTSPTPAITNPCGEIVLNALGGYCVIADVVPFHATTTFRRLGPAQETFDTWDDDAEDAFRTATRALIRTNTMESLYAKEVRRTNRIGVGFTGIHEYAWARFGYGWKRLVNERMSRPFWLMLSRFKRAVMAEARSYAAKLGVPVPHTNTTVKPAGTTSKLFGLTEGAHLPTMREYLRWVQFRNDDPLIEAYRTAGYPVRELTTYSGTTIVGFPTAPMICSLGMGDGLVTAAEATPEEQYEWLRLLEKYWIVGVEEDGVTPLEDHGNQVSYTLKYDPAKVSFEEFKRTLFNGQSTVRCCSVMPQGDTSAYEYQPEQPVSKAEYELIRAAIKVESEKEDVDFVHVDCGSGGCPIDFSKI